MLIPNSNKMLQLNV